ncbi:helix-turn-helix transcriptional regulator [Anaeropeptidivorans aminofermentans]|uniref:helix-turn-helix transcriptional regulator n=1 Tax=Anaeropeptidivorans aminofermentans TaxID=2934315 RepID=UPI0020242C7A|nr:LuxR C-terminal-related transcriptional regulator [Anaeropeptidivorans aminofermentans]
MSQTISKQEKYYFSDKLKEQLSQISQYPLTIIEAPSGFGKTTAVREYLRNELPEASCQWYICLGESAPIAWLGICELFSRINSEVANNMKSLKMPTLDTLFHMTSYLKNLECRNKTYFVIDNYQLINFDMHRELINVFSMHEDPNLHMIFITQQLDFRQQLSIHNNNIHTIDASSFFFDKEGIANLFRMEGLRITENELENIFKNTEGWISAIRLQMINYKESGSFIYSAGIEHLVETAIWNRLGSVEKDFLLKVSVFDSFTAQQAAEILDHEVLPGKIEEELKSSDFVRFLPDKRLFIINGIFLDYLRNRFYHHQPRAYQKKVFYKAGISCAAMGQYCLATKFFYTIRDFDSILSLPFTRQYLDSQKEECDEAMFVEIVRECPEEILCRYPSAIVVFGHYAHLNEQHEIYKKLCRLLRSLMQNKPNLSQEEIRRFNAELVLLEVLGEFNDITKMKEGYKKARDILEDSSDIIEHSTPWFSVFPTAFGIFWRESGKLDEMLNTIDEIRPFYRSLSQGQGAGLGHLIRAEAVLSKGEDNEAEILCHKALYEARTYRQFSICIYAELSLARIFILRGDSEKFFTAIKNIQSFATDYSDPSIHRMVDMCMSIISLTLGVKDYVAPWFYNIEGIRKLLYAPVIPFAEIWYFRLLLIDKRYNELFAFSQLALDTLRNSGAKVQYMMPQIHSLIFLSLAKHKSGNDLEAQMYLKEALAIALPDQVYLPFADYDCMTNLLTGINICYFDNPMKSAPSHKNQKETFMLNSFDALTELCKRQQKGISTIRKSLIQVKSTLTSREREIALLAKERLSAKEIADKLYISETTVKTTLRNVYSKLDIHSRSELATIEF